MQATFQTNPPVSPSASGIREQLEATTRALAVAEEACAPDALATVHWERRGVLGRLVRASRS
jgi:hypothetical protein